MYSKYFFTLVDHEYITPDNNEQIETNGNQTVTYDAANNIIFINNEASNDDSSSKFSKYILIDFSKNPSVCLLVRTVFVLFTFESLLKKVTINQIWKSSHHSILIDITGKIELLNV